MEILTSSLLFSELEAELSAFRSTLSQDWIRRATRMLSLEGVSPASVAQARRGYVDPEWESRERSFHETTMRNINEVVRKFNIIAPYAVRRPFFALDSELARCYRLSQPVIEAELQRRLDGTDQDRLPIREREERKIEGDLGGEQEKAVKESMWKAFKRVVVEALSKGPDPAPATSRRT